MPRSRALVRVLVVCGLCTGAQGEDGGKLGPDLVRPMEGVGPRLVPVAIAVRGGAGAFDLAELRRMPARARRGHVIGVLRAQAAGAQGALLRELARMGEAGEAADVHPLWIANVVTARVSPAGVRRLAVRDDVEWIGLDSACAGAPAPDGGGGGGGGGARGDIACGIAAANAPAAWAEGITGEGVVVGVIDTGTCLTHPDIAGQIWINAGEIPGNHIDDDANGFTDDVYGWNFKTGGNDVSDPSGHGSHVAGTLAGDGTRGTQCGMAPDARVMTLVFADELSGESSVWSAMQYALENGAGVVSGSLGWLHLWAPKRAIWRAACENAFAAGVVVVFSAGGEGSAFGVDSVTTPGDVPDMITVGTTDCSLVVASFSSRGPVTWEDVNPYNDWPYPPGKLKPTVSGPGIETISHNRCSGYVIYSGSSMAVPHVSGAAALMLEANPALDHYQVKQILKDTAIDRGPAGEDNTYGHGFLDAWAAVEAARDMACTADFNGDGVVNTLDVLAFLNAWSAGEAGADINGDGAVNTLDVLAFLNVWTLGC